MKNVVVLGGGTGISSLLRGLKEFPVDVTAIITVSDNGSSTGALKEELNIPAVGDVGKVIMAMAHADRDMVDLLGYRFSHGSLENHPIRNILLAALIDLQGDLTEATQYLSRLLGVRGTIYPLTEEKVELVGVGGDREFYGEMEVSENVKKIHRLTYDHDITVRTEITEKIRSADLIILPPGSLYTSIIPHLLSDDVVEAIRDSKAPVMYVANLVTQPGETDDPRLSRHIRVLNRFLRYRKVDVCIANDSPVDPFVVKRYLDTEGKNMLVIDRDKVEEMGCRVISGDVFQLDEEDKVRHHAVKTGYMVFSYIMKVLE